MLFFRKHEQDDEVSVPHSGYAAIPHKKLKKELAVAVNERQFVLYMQPKINLENWAIQGVEVLLRWQHPQHGLIQPEYFIPVLEETGLISEVGLWVLDEACRENKQWQDSGLKPLQVSINISCAQLQKNDFLDSVITVINKTGFAPELLEFEFSDTCLFDSIDTHIQSLHKIRHQGIKIALKYSITGLPITLDLSERPVDSINIDKELTHQITNNKENRQIMSTILDFSHEHKIDVVAEGVETAEQLIFLTAMQCKMAQGFLFNHPINIARFEELYRTNTKYDHLIKKIAHQWKVE